MRNFFLNNKNNFSGPTSPISFIMVLQLWYRLWEQIAGEREITVLSCVLECYHFQVSYKYIHWRVLQRIFTPKEWLYSRPDLNHFLIKMQSNLNKIFEINCLGRIVKRVILDSGLFRQVINGMVWGTWVFGADPWITLTDSATEPHSPRPLQGLVRTYFSGKIGTSIWRRTGRIGTTFQWGCILCCWCSHTRYCYENGSNLF